jgi:COP9 signalosome complex subunit 6
MESVILHPLPLIAISDYVVRHTLRQLTGPVVGALFGQQNGREISIEFAYEVQTLTNGDEITLEPSWFETRLEQSKSSLSASPGGMVDPANLTSQ